MAHFALIDENNIVVNVIVVANEQLQDKNGVETESLGASFCQEVVGPGRWVQTSRNTHRGIHLDPDSLLPDGGKAFRGNYAEIGFKYYEDLDVFAPANKPDDIPEWFELNVDGCWSCPVGLHHETGLPLSDEQWEFLEIVYGQPTPINNPDIRT